MRAQENQFSKEQSNLRVLATLSSEGALSWSELLKKTKLSRTTLSRSLYQLKEEELVTDSLGRTGKSGRPLVIYTLEQKSLGKKKETSELLKPIIEILRIEQLSDQFTKFFLAANRGSTRDLVEIAREYFHTIVDGMGGILEWELLRDRSASFRDSTVTLEAIAAIRRILMENEFVRTFSVATREELQKDRDETLDHLEKQVRKYQRLAQRASAAETIRFGKV